MNSDAIRKTLPAAFTLAELIVVIAILAILSAVAFVSLSGYSKDARESASKANARSVYSAISIESTRSSVSPRYFISHDPDFALTGTNFIVFWDASAPLVPWSWNEAGTNYSAGNPDFSKLKLDPEKFKISFEQRFLSPFPLPTYASDASLVLVWAADVSSASSWSAVRSESFVQVAAMIPDSNAFVVGDYSQFSPNSAEGLIRDVSDPSWTGAITESTESWLPEACAAATLSWYSVPAMASGWQSVLSKNISNGSLSVTATCSSGSASLSDETISCSEWYVPSWLSCVPDVCWGQAPGSDVPNAVSTATSQSVSWTWHHSASPGLCTFSCEPDYVWDGTSCKAPCQIPAVDDYLWNSYAVTPHGMLLHGSWSVSSALSAFWTSPAHGTLQANFSYACSNGTLSRTAVSQLSWSCQANYTWNSNWNSPSCAANTKTFSCAAKPANSHWNSVSSYVQTWNGTAWTPSDSVSSNNAASSVSECRFACDTNYTWNGSSCVANTRSVACGWSVPANAAASTAATYSQTWNGSAWAPTKSWTNAAVSCGFACNSWFAWNGSSCASVVPPNSTACWGLYWYNSDLYWPDYGGWFYGGLTYAEADAKCKSTLWSTWRIPTQGEVSSCLPRFAWVGFQYYWTSTGNKVWFLIMDGALYSWMSCNPSLSADACWHYNLWLLMMAAKCVRNQ